MSCKPLFWCRECSVHPATFPASAFWSCDICHKCILVAQVHFDRVTYATSALWSCDICHKCILVALSKIKCRIWKEIPSDVVPSPPAHRPRAKVRHHPSTPHQESGLTVSNFGQDAAANSEPTRTQRQVTRNSGIRLGLLALSAAGRLVATLNPFRIANVGTFYVASSTWQKTMVG